MELVLADGTVFSDRSFGALREAQGEVVFHAGMVGGMATIPASLEAYFEESVTHSAPITHVDITTLWDACWEAWLTCDPAAHLELGAFMAAVKAAYPSLPGKPDWMVVGDPEET